MNHVSKKPADAGFFLSLPAVLKHMFGYDKMKKMKIKKADLIIFICALAVFGLLWLFSSLFLKKGDTVIVTVNGEQTGSYPLNEDRTVNIKGYDGGENTLLISGGHADMIHADCPGEDCVYQKAVSADGETIVCLPHRVVIRISSGEENSIDAVAR